MAEKKSELVVPVADGPKHGYYGTVPDDTPNEAYTVKGQVGRTAKVTDTPKSALSESKSASKS